MIVDVYGALINMDNVTMIDVYGCEVVFHFVSNTEHREPFHSKEAAYAYLKELLEIIENDTKK